MDHFREIAKMRAARMIWAKIVKSFHPKIPNRCRYEHTVRHRAGRLRNKTRSTTWPVRVRKPWRLLWGIQSLHTNALDEAIALPTDFSARIARNTQLYLQDETEICRAIDPWAGSYYVESLTHHMAHKAWELIQEIEDLGGMAKAIETGIPKLRIEEAAARTQAKIDAGEQIVVGVNKYRLDKEDP